jgi:hypothetical protein
MRLVATVAAVIWIAGMVPAYFIDQWLDEHYGLCETFKFRPLNAFQSRVGGAMIWPVSALVLPYAIYSGGAGRWPINGKC